ncbi:MAG: leucine-rich repeat protein [Lachnospiraceae bacterium]|nr:leucine-rich repeat protein [Lachnospiraceae bacterium]
MFKALKRVLVCTLAAAVTLGSAGVASAAQSPTQSVEPEKNASVKVSNVTVSTTEKGTATLKKIAKTNKKSVVVASKVKVDGVTYTVTIINANAFANCKKATKVTIPATIKTIKKNAFKGAKALKTLTFKGKKAVTVKKGAFAGLNTKKMTIKVSKKMSKKEFTKFKKALKKAGFKGKIKKA